MISDKILCRNSQVHGIPVLKLFAESFKLVFSNVTAFLLLVSFTKENVIESTDTQLFGFDSRWSSLGSIHVPLSLQHVSNSVVCHIDCRIRQRLNHELLVPWDSRTKAGIA